MKIDEENMVQDGIASSHPESLSEFDCQTLGARTPLGSWW